MDLDQRKLTRSEWTSIELPVSDAERQVLRLLKDGYHDVNVRHNHCQSLFLFLKIEATVKNEDFLFQQFLQPHCVAAEQWLGVASSKKVVAKAKINSADRIRLERFDVAQHRAHIFDFVLLDHVARLVQHARQPLLFHQAFLTLQRLAACSVAKVNRHVTELVQRILVHAEPLIDLLTVVRVSPDAIERNKELLQYADMCLYDHQKQLFTACKRRSSSSTSGKPMLALYIAPTGTGKTLSPIALSEGHKIIFVCAARHVGLAMAKAAISMGKRIAFAFGCSSADDIRLHYFAAKEYIKHRKSGRILKVDNSVGDNVEILVCDIRSYLPAMHYMLAFFPATTILTYWDEPTITLDYPSHDLHAVIRRNWKKNVIPNLVLSSATLPKLHELGCTISDFQTRFPGAEVVNVVSHDCKKSIPLIDNDGHVVLPHFLSADLVEVQRMCAFCEANMTLLRYLDLTAVVDFVTYVHDQGLVPPRCALDRFFESAADVTMQSVKLYYLTLVRQMSPGEPWIQLVQQLRLRRVPRIVANTKVDSHGNSLLHKANSVGPGSTVTQKAGHLQGQPLSRLASAPVVASGAAPIQGTIGAYVTTKDAHTLTDGPTIFITDDVEKVARFCIEQANIPMAIMDEILKKIEHNNQLNAQLHRMEQESDFIRDQVETRAKNEVSAVHKDAGTGKKGIKVTGRNKGSKDPKKLNRETDEDVASNQSLSKLAQDMRNLKSLIKSVRLHDMFVPNKQLHKEKWAPDLDPQNAAFTSDVEDHVVNDIMALNGVDNRYKILLMMGIGVFIKHTSVGYTELMKQLAEEQKLYMIIATSDYIYGTNYQFCHGFLGKDLRLTQEKIVQAMGRVGRNNVQQLYTLRFRDDQMLRQLFTEDAAKPEVIHMNVLFNSRRVVYQAETGTYEELPPEEGDDDDAEENPWDDDDADELDEEEGLEEDEEEDANVEEPEEDFVLVDEEWS